MQNRTKLSPYYVLLVIGKIQNSAEGKIYGYELVTSKTNQNYPYQVLRKLAELNLLVREQATVDPATRGARPRYYYRLTEKGRRFGEKYNAKAIAANPPLVPLEEFV